MQRVMTKHSLSAERLHFAWDNSLTPVLEIAAGDTVTFETWDASGHHFTRTSTREDVPRPRPHAGHALTGPVFVRGALPGDTLVVEVLEVAPAAWGWTAHGPKGGLLPMDFPEPYLRIWDLTDGCFAQGMAGVRVPLSPFCGVMGVALGQTGSHSTVPPRRVGGNMDVRQLGAGSTLYLPIEVDGALFSVGDAHGVQGDGEVCITAVEMDSTTTLRFGVSQVPISEPQIRLSGPPTTIAGPYHGCTAHAPDLMDAARNATRHLIDWLGREAHLSPEDAYALSSVAAELRISQIVDAPNWTVTAWFPLAVLTDR
jgi:acetamidase/formamidase